MKKLFYGIALILVAAWVIGKLSPDTSENSSDSASGIGPATSVNASSPAASQKAACDVGSPASGAVVAVTGDYELRTTPSGSGARIKNEKASSRKHLRSRQARDRAPVAALDPDKAPASARVTAAE